MGLALRIDRLHGVVIHLRSHSVAYRDAVVRIEDPVDTHEDSAVRIFGDALGDPVADEIYRTLKVAGEAGMNRTEIRDLFGRHQSAGRISAALALLITKGRAAPKTTATDGRPLETWYAMS